MRRLTPRQRLSDRVWCKGAYSTYERAAAEVIARHLNKEGTAWPGLERIAELGGMCPRKAQDAMKVLVEGDPSRGLYPLLTRTPRARVGGKGRGYIYRLVEKPEALARARILRVVDPAARAVVQPFRERNGPPTVVDQHRKPNARQERPGPEFPSQSLQPITTQDDRAEATKPASTEPSRRSREQEDKIRTSRVEEHRARVRGLRELLKRNGIPCPRTRMGDNSE
jgi:hypothetical protein